VRALWSTALAIGDERIPAGIRVPSAMPRMVRVHQRFPRPRLDDVPAAVRAEMRRLDLRTRVRPRARIAVTAGSRGIRDGILVVSRIKPHTGFSHPFGSGVMKMLGVGLGKAPGAAQIHQQGPGQMASAIREIAECVIGTGRVLGGLAILENAYDETARVVGIAPERIPDVEVALFPEA